jgi:hypothetical protein
MAVVTRCTTSGTGVGRLTATFKVRGGGMMIRLETPMQEPATISALAGTITPRAS